MSTVDDDNRHFRLPQNHNFDLAIELLNKRIADEHAQSQRTYDCLLGERTLSAQLGERIDGMRETLKLADNVAAALQDMGDFWAYGMAKTEGADPTYEDHKAVENLSRRAREALDAYRKSREA